VSEKVALAAEAADSLDEARVRAEDLGLGKL